MMEGYLHVPMNLSWWWRQQVPLKHQYMSIRLYSARYQSVVIFIVNTVTTSDLMDFFAFFGAGVVQAFWWRDKIVAFSSLIMCPEDEGCCFLWHVCNHLRNNSDEDHDLNFHCPEHFEFWNDCSFSVQELICSNNTFPCRDLRPTSLDKGQETFRLRLYQLYAWGGPLLIAGIAAILDNLPGEAYSSLLRPRFGQQRCWFYGMFFSIRNSILDMECTHTCMHNHICTKAR